MKLILTITLIVFLSLTSQSRANQTAPQTGEAPHQKDVFTSRKALAETGSFDRELELQGIRFHVSSANNSSINEVTIQPEGLEIDNSRIVREVAGTVTGAEVADLNSDNSPEIYIYINSAGSGSYGSVLAYSANRRKSLSDIYMPPLTENAEAAVGYMGHDEFAVLEGVLGRRYPIYLEGDSNAKPTGGMRQVDYKLFPGEAGWILKPDRITEY